MPNHSLEYRSPKKHVKLLSDDTPHTAIINDWSVSEAFEPNTLQINREHLGTYQLVIMKPVETREDVRKGLDEASELASELDIAWFYVCASPFISARTEATLYEAPAHWTGNTRAVEIAIQKARGTGYSAAMQVVQHRWSTLPEFPLARVLTVREAIQNASNELSHLIELHAGAHKADLGRLFLLAKALELAGGMVGHKADKNLQQEMERIGIASQLTKPVKWLFEMSNERFDTRHAKKKRRSLLKLHQRMNASELHEFKQNADLVIRAFICDQLGVDQVAWQDSRGNLSPL